MGKLIDLDGYKAVSTELKKYIDDVAHEIQLNAIVSKNTYLDFPLVGDKNSVYIDVTANEVYRYDDENLRYYCIGTDYHNIEVINGGNSES